MGSGFSASSKKVDLNGKGVKDLKEVKNVQLLKETTSLEIIDLTKNKIESIPQFLRDDIATSPLLIENVVQLILKKNRLPEVPEPIFLLCAT